jgi:hypothetical protein
MKNVIAALALSAAVASPIAAAGPVASSLSVARAIRAGAPSTGAGRLTGRNVGPVAAAIIAAGIAVGATLLIVDKEDDSDSN